MSTQDSQVYHMTNAIQVQSGAVVSKTLVNKSAGTVTLFAFDEGQTLSEHTAPYDALVHILEGEAEITLAGVPYSVKDGEALLMPANVPHALKAVKPLYILEKEWVSLHNMTVKEWSVFTPFRTEKVTALCRMLPTPNSHWTAYLALFS